MDWRRVGFVVGGVGCIVLITAFLVFHYAELVAWPSYRDSDRCPKITTDFLGYRSGLYCPHNSFASGEGRPFYVATWILFHIGFVLFIPGAFTLARRLQSRLILYACPLISIGLLLSLTSAGIKPIILPSQESSMDATIRNMQTGLLSWQLFAWSLFIFYVAGILLGLGVTHKWKNLEKASIEPVFIAFTGFLPFIPIYGYVVVFPLATIFALLAKKPEAIPKPTQGIV